MSKFKGFSRIATSYDANEVRMAVAALEGADILAITPGMQLNSVMPHFSLAMGPVEIHVPEELADEATELLNAIAEGSVVAEDQEEQDWEQEPIRSEATIGDKIRNLLGFAVGGVSQPLKGLSVDKRDAKDD